MRRSCRIISDLTSKAYLRPSVNNICNVNVFIVCMLHVNCASVAVQLERRLASRRGARQTMQSLYQYRQHCRVRKIFLEDRKKKSWYIIENTQGITRDFEKYFFFLLITEEKFQSLVDL